MSGILVGRPLNGIPLNGLEFLLDENGVEPLRFQNEEKAKSFLREHGLTNEQIRDVCFVEEDDGERECADD